MKNKEIKILPENLKRIFIKDNKFPIHMVEEEQFKYLVNLYEPWIKTKTKYNELLSIINSYDNLELYEKAKKSLHPKIYDILNTSTVKNELQQDIKEIDKRFPFPTHNFNTINVFHRDYVGEKILSLDMVKANWQVWRLLGLTDKKQSYQDWIKSLGGNDYMANSKMLRQALFGEIEPKRVQRIQKSFSLAVALALQKENYKIVSWSADELVINLTNKLGKEETVSNRPDIMAHITDILKEKTPEIEWRAQEWNLSTILLEKDWVLQESKELIEGTPQSREIDFRNVPNFFLPQVYKAYIGQDLEPQDMYFEHNGYPSTFLTPVDLKEFKISRIEQLQNQKTLLNEVPKTKRKTI